jgi:hypothetical protein
MYAAVLASIIGRAMLLGRFELLGPAEAVAVGAVAFVRRHEEPLLRRRFGAEYNAYRVAAPGPAVVLALPRLPDRLSCLRLRSSRTGCCACVPATPGPAPPSGNWSPMSSGV